MARRAVSSSAVTWRSTPSGCMARPGPWFATLTMPAGGGRKPWQPVGRDALGVVAAGAQQPEALVLEAARRHGRAREEHDARLVEQRLGPLLVPRAPARERLLRHLHVLLVGAIVHAHDLADVRRL